MDTVASREEAVKLKERIQEGDRQLGREDVRG